MADMKITPNPFSPYANDLATLRDMTANLQQYIDQRATELAAPLIEEAREAAAIEVKSAQGMQQRAEDLVAELRRQLDIRERQNTRYRERAEAAQAAAGRALVAMRANTQPSPVHPTDYQRGYQACADHVTAALHDSTPQETVHGEPCTGKRS